MITEDYVSFETAKLLKERGFYVNCYTHYSSNGQKVYYNYQTPSDGINMPTHQMAMKWLREEHKIGIFPRQYHIYKEYGVYDEFGYGVEIIKLGTDIPLNPNGEKISDKDKYFISTSYEQSCEVAIKYCLEKLI